MSKPSLISAHPSTSGIEILLHPLVLLTVSDYLTRHTVRHIKGPVIGALLGTQQGRKVEIENAFEVKSTESENGDITVDAEWLGIRIGLFKETHPNSDIQGWFTISHNPTFEPTPADLQVHTQFLPFNESPLLLVLNPTASASVGGKLPIAIFESIYEAPSIPAGSDGEDVAMDDDEKDKEVEKEGGLLKFVGPLKYTLETGEAEMIGVDLIAKGVGNASVDERVKEVVEEKVEGKGKGKEKAEVKANHYTQHDAGGSEELVAALTSKANAIKMLHARISLLREYLTSISSDPSSPNYIPPSHPILRSLKALTFSRLNLVLPPSIDGNTALSSFNIESIQEENEVRLVALMGALLKSVKELQEVNSKFKILEQGKAYFEQGFQPMGMGGMRAGFSDGGRGAVGRFARGRDD